MYKRSMVIKGLADVKGAKERLDKCQPSEKLLFGADLAELAKAIKNEVQFKGRKYLGDSSYFVEMAKGRAGL